MTYPCTTGGASASGRDTSRESESQGDTKGRFKLNGSTHKAFATSIMPDLSAARSDTTDARPPTASACGGLPLSHVALVLLVSGHDLDAVAPEFDRGSLVLVLSQPDKVAGLEHSSTRLV